MRVTLSKKLLFRVGTQGRHDGGVRRAKDKREKSSQSFLVKLLVPFMWTQITLPPTHLGRTGTTSSAGGEDSLRATTLTSELTPTHELCFNTRATSRGGCI